MKPQSIELAASVIFMAAVLHTFSAGWVRRLAHRFKRGSPAAKAIHLLGEVEMVFGVWAIVLAITMLALQGVPATLRYFESLRFTEPLFVFVVMAIASSPPVVYSAERILERVSGGIARWMAISSPAAFYVSALFFSPLLGSLITEPAAMTVTAVLLRNHFFARSRPLSDSLKYATIGALFVNVSIGGTFTRFAAPPVVMVASRWDWDNFFMLTHFGWKAGLAMLVTTAGTAWWFRDEIGRMTPPTRQERASLSRGAPVYLIGLHLALLAAVVATSHHPMIFSSIFVAYLTLATATRTRKDDLDLRPSLFVGFFLAGLVILGGLQSWWLSPLLRSLGPTSLYLGSAALTAVMDNAALTYLISQVEGLSSELKYMAVAGAVVGGGLTVIANAPNPAGYEILKDRFGPKGISPLRLALGAAPATLIALAAFYLL